MLRPRPRPLGLAVPTDLPAIQQTAAAITTQPLVKAATFGMLAGAITVAFSGTECKTKPSYAGAAIAGGIAALLFGLVGDPDATQQQPIAYAPVPEYQPTPGF